MRAFGVLVFLFLLLTLAGNAQTVLWNEATDGSLDVFSNSSSSPTVHFVGTASDPEDLVEGTLVYRPTGNGNGVTYPDAFSFTIPVGSVLTGLELTDSFSYDTNVSQYDEVSAYFLDSSGNYIGSDPDIAEGSGYHSLNSEYLGSQLPADTYTLALDGLYSAPAYEPQPTQDDIITYIVEIDTAAVPEPNILVELFCGIFVVFILKHQGVAGGFPKR